MKAFRIKTRHCIKMYVLEFDLNFIHYWGFQKRRVSQYHGPGGARENNIKKTKKHR